MGKKKMKKAAAPVVKATVKTQSVTPVAQSVPVPVPDVTRFGYEEMLGELEAIVAEAGRQPREEDAA